MATDPLVSVCIPTYNGAAHIAEALRSVLDQRLGDLEVLVRDDGSTDGTPAIVQGFPDGRLRFAANATNLGPGRNWNRMLEDVRGRYVKVMGQDDVLHPDCLDEQVRALERHPEAAFTTCRRDVVDPAGAVLFRARGLPGMAGLLSAEELLPRIVASGGNPLGEPVAGLMRRSAVEAVGPYRPEMAYVIDLDYWVRLLEHGPMVAIPRSLCAFRVAPGSWSMALASRQAAQVGALQRALREARPDLVPLHVYLRGRALALALAAARRLVYLRMRGGGGP